MCLMLALLELILFIRSDLFSLKFVISNFLAIFLLYTFFIEFAMFFCIFFPTRIA
jgi:hypothetical protein